MKHRYVTSAPILLFTVSLVLFAGLAGCMKNEPPGKSQGSIVATVNGKPISTELFEAYATLLSRRPAKDLTPEQRTQILDTFIAMRLATDKAEMDGTAKKSDIETQLTLARMNVLSDAVLRKYFDDHPISDAELKAEYDTQVAAVGLEYKARHILVESRAAADGVVAELNKGADFGKLAAKNSIDPSGKSGGDLGWFNLQSMVPQFSSAVAALEKGKYTTVPVQTQFGWHVIKLEDTRSTSAPPFEEVKEKVKTFVQRKKTQAYLEELRKAAKIEKVAAAPEPLPAPPAVPAPAAPEAPETK